MTAVEHLDLFIKGINTPKAETAEIIALLTLTQQEDSKLLKNITPINALSNMQQILSEADSITTKLKHSTNPIMKDCIITIGKRGNKPLKIQVRLVKEIAPRKGSEDGKWGINATSFKYLNPPKK